MRHDMSAQVEERFRAMKIAEVELHRRNLFQVSRLCIKALLDKSCFESIDDTTPEVRNLLVSIEQLLSHGLRTSSSWLGAVEHKHFWPFLARACREMTNNCVDQVSKMDGIKHPLGRGRLFLRMALMEKRLHEYLSTARVHTDLLRAFYTPYAAMQATEMSIFIGELVGLRSLDLTFCLRGEILDFPDLFVPDFTCFMRFEQTIDSRQSDAREFAGVDEEDMWGHKFAILEGKMNEAVQQKSFLEEVQRTLDSRLRILHTESDALRERLSQADSERALLEAVVLELQTEMTKLVEQRDAALKRVSTLEEQLDRKQRADSVEMVRINVPETVTLVQTEQSTLSGNGHE